VEIGGHGAEALGGEIADGVTHRAAAQEGDAVAGPQAEGGETGGQGGALPARPRAAVAVGRIDQELALAAPAARRLEHAADRIEPVHEPPRVAMPPRPS
jgi:hypothetical protein